MAVDLAAARGARATAEQVAKPHLSASEMGSGDLLVFATPAMVALMEAAAMKALAPFLPAGWTTVGTSISTSHVAATPMGLSVTAEATVTEAEKRSATIQVVARDASGDVIGEGTHTRVAVDAEKFLGRCEAKLESSKPKL
mmetsp:Transcript_51222/g.141793  ORF Transcript_51222/g.141793 Transcript_51222/m.141793 type:complete len:141 (-) Transcript_51222:53-475(-)